MAGSRECEQRGTVLVRRREPARFCSVGCRTAGNREHIGEAAPALSTANGRITGWKWKAVPLPVLTSLPPRAREMTRYQAYQAQLAGHTSGETFRPSATFLSLAVTYSGWLADLANTDASNHTVCP